MAITKKNKKMIAALVIGLLITLGAAFLYANYGRKEEAKNTNENTNTPLQDTNNSDEDTNKQDVSENNIYSKDAAGIAFKYPKTYSVAQDQLGSGQVNAKLILKHTDGATITFWENIHGLVPEFADFIYYMKKSDDVFVVDKRLEGEIPERDTESFSIIANFGDAEGTSKMAGKTWLVILSSVPKNTHEEEFKAILSSLKEI